MSDLMIFNCTHGKEDPERATLPFIAANIAATAGRRVAVVCTVEAAWLGTKGYVDDIQAEGLPPLAKVFAELVDSGGEVWLCNACTKPRGITEEHCVPGASIVGAARVVEEIANGAKSVAFA